MTERAADQAVDELRRAFDSAFARPRPATSERGVELLSVRAGGRRLALRSSETAGILRCPPLTPVPGDCPTLLGLAGVRGTLLAVHSLEALVGGALAPGRGGWLARFAADPSAALRFDELLGYVRVDTDAIRGTVGSEAAAGGEQTVRIDDAPTALLDLPHLLNHLRRSDAPAPGKEP